METAFTLKEMFIHSWPVMSLLLALSVISWAVIIERAKRLKVSSHGNEDTKIKVETLISQRKFQDIQKLCHNNPNSVSCICRGIFSSEERASVERMETLIDRSIRIELEDLGRRLVILGTIGATAPFIGLFGTVIGIIKAFRALTFAHTGGPGVVANGIAEALVNTALGLFVAIPAVVAFNYFANRIRQTGTKLELAGEEILDKYKKVEG
ncbi:MAG: MotA/TolQ/ExbB proton channel family protein [Elusimicrobiota bacterium]